MNPFNTARELHGSMQKEISDLVSHLQTEFQWTCVESHLFKKEWTLFLTRTEFLGLIRQFCETACCQFGERQVIPVVSSHLWRASLTCGYQKFTRNGQQMTGYVIKDTREVIEKSFAEFNF